MLTKGSRIAVLSIVTVLSVALAMERRANDRLRSDNAAIALRADSMAAALDSTRLVSASNHAVAAALGDSMQLYQRRVVQTVQTADAVDGALKLERRGKYALAVSVDSLSRLVSASRTTSDTGPAGIVVHARFNLRQAPYTVASDVDVPVPPSSDTARMSLRISLDEIPVVARLSCAPPNAQGIRAASIEASAPQWAAVRFSKVQQSPDLCVSPALVHATAHRWIRPAIVAGVGKVTTGDGALHWGAFAGVGISLGG